MIKYSVNQIARLEINFIRNKRCCRFLYYLYNFLPSHHLRIELLKRWWLRLNTVTFRRDPLIESEKVLETLGKYVQLKRRMKPRFFLQKIIIEASTFYVCAVPLLLAIYGVLH